MILSKSSVSSSSIVDTSGFCSGSGSALYSVIFATSLFKSGLFSKVGFGVIDWIISTLSSTLGWITSFTISSFGLINSVWIIFGCGIDL